MEGWPFAWNCRFTLMANRRTVLPARGEAHSASSTVPGQGRDAGRLRSTGLVQAYSFTSRIAKALVDANRRGVKIQVILNKSNQTDNYSWPEVGTQDYNRRNGN